MARLVLSLDGQVMAEYNMNKERYTIGRLPDNDIRIDNPAVSGHHSLIINILNDSFLEDLNSTNGTYVNGKLIKKHALAARRRHHGGPPPAALRRGRRAAGRIRKDDGHPAVVAPGREAARGRRCGGAGRRRRCQPPARAARSLRRLRRPLQESEAAGSVRRLRGPRAGAEQGAHDARPPRCAGRGDHAPRRWLLHRSRRQRKDSDYPAAERHGDRVAGHDA